MSSARIRHDVNQEARNVPYQDQRKLYHPRRAQRHKLMIVAGEPSGDAHAAALVKALREHGDFDVFGATGPLMRDAGVETIVNSDELAIMGIVEVGRVFQKFIKAFRN